LGVSPPRFEPGNDDVDEELGLGVRGVEDADRLASSREEDSNIVDIRDSINFACAKAVWMPSTRITDNRRAELSHRFPPKASAH
jgi:hypothetical protein